MTQDRDLVAELLASRNEGVFRELYRIHTPRLYQFALRLLGGVVPEAEEAVQDTWVRALSKLDSFGGRSEFLTWLIGINLNVCRERFRRRRVRKEKLALFPGRQNQPPSPDRRLDLEEAIARLPDGYRAVIVLHDVEGWTHEEIADRLEVTVGTSKSQLFSARRRMRELLTREGEIPDGRAKRVGTE